MAAEKSGRKLERNDIRTKTDREDIRIRTADDLMESAEASPETSASSAAGEAINWQVLSSGGNTATSTNFSLSGTVAQTAVGLSNSTGYIVHHGFWQTFGNGSCCMRRGDVDGNGQADVLDIDFFINWLFRAGAAPGCADEADVDGSGQPDVLDVDYFISYLYRSGPVLVPCP